MPVFGSPTGTSSSLSRRYGAAAAVGSAGERRTAEVLAQAYGRDPYTWVFHNLAVPGWVRGNIDHVVVRGSTVVVLDTKCWAPGRYVTVLGRTWRNWRRFAAADRLQLGAMAQALAGRLGVAVHPLVVIWPSHPGALRTGRPFRLVLPGDLAYCKGRQLLGALEGLLGARDAPYDERVHLVLSRLTRRRRVSR
ncbi:MAG TPA: NERD domain-containing protein [Acidimicrobiales bacterium]|nr:NERD domain-containing protein [Acidimicrobiales bacterium]